MTKKVLLVNQDGSPLTILKPEKALMLLFLDKAVTLFNYSNVKVNTVNKTFEYPSVIKLNNYFNVVDKFYIPLTRKNLLKRDKHQCVYCGSTKKLTIDHVIPKSKGGKSTWGNLVIACSSCNSRKSNRDLSELGWKINTKLKRPLYIDFLKNIHENERNEYWEYFFK